MARGKRTQADLALQVCTPQFFINLGDEEHPWEARDLFPEISIPPTHHITQSVPKNSKKVAHNPKPKKNPPSLKPRRSNRIGKKKSGVLDIDVHSFLDVPLQQSECTELLSLIGAGNFPIPSHVLLNSQNKTGNLEMGQPSKTPSKKSKQFGPIANPPAPLQNPGPTAESPAPLQNPGPIAKPSLLLQNPGPSFAVEAQPKSHIELMQCEPHHGEVGPSVPAGSRPSPRVVDSDDLDDQIEDPYLDRVDYSDEDPPL